MFALFRRRDRAVEAYRAEVNCMTRLRHDVIHLRALSSSQQELINSLVLENKHLRKSKADIGTVFIVQINIAGSSLVNTYGITPLHITVKSCV